MEIIIGGMLIVIFVAVVATRPRRKVETEHIDLPGQAVCIPGRHNCISGMYLGDASQGGYMQDQEGIVQREASHGHPAHFADLPQEAPDMGGRFVRTGNHDARTNNSQPQRWEQLNADEWARVNQREHNEVRR